MLINNEHIDVSVVCDACQSLPSYNQVEMRNSPETFAYQKVHSTAHAVVAAVVAHHGAVIQETDEKSLHQGHKVLHLWPQSWFLSSTVQQAGTQTQALITSWQYFSITLRCQM